MKIPIASSVFFASGAVFGMCIPTDLPMCQYLYVKSTIKKERKIVVWGQKEKANLEYCEVMMKSDQNGKTYKVNLATCPEETEILGTINFACNDTQFFSVDKIVPKIPEECPDLKKWWQVWK